MNFYNTDRKFYEKANFNFVIVLNELKDFYTFCEKYYIKQSLQKCECKFVAFMSSLRHQDSCKFLRSIQTENLDYKPSYIKHWNHYKKFRYSLHNININNNLIKDDNILYDKPDLPIIDKFDKNVNKKFSELKLKRSHRNIDRFEKIYRNNEMNFDDYVLVHRHRYKYELFNKINVKTILFLKIHKRKHLIHYRKYKECLNKISTTCCCDKINF
jgi:hypothetical protein